MKKVAIAVLLGSAAMLAAGAAQAGPGHRGGHHHHSRAVVTRVYVGAPFYPVYPRYYYPAPAYYVQPAPTYTEQATPALAPGYWYFCPPAQAYYPRVATCPVPWQRVAPQPPPG